MRNGFTDIPVASADSSTDAIWLEKSSPSRMAPERMSLSTFPLRIHVPFARAAIVGSRMRVTCSVHGVSSVLS